MYADPRWVRGVKAGFMVGPHEMQDRKGHCPMMVIVDVKGGEPGDEGKEEQGSDEGDDDRRQQWVQQVHIKMRQGSHVPQAMRRASNMCGFSRQAGESQAQPKLQRLLATLRKGQQEEVEARAGTEGAVWQEEVPRGEKRVRVARRAVEDVHESVYQKVLAEHERYIEGAPGGWTAAGDQGSEAAGWQNQAQETEGAGAGCGQLPRTAQPGAAGAQ